MCLKHMFLSPGVMWESPLVNRTYFYLALACLTFNMTMLAYLAIWCTSVLKIEEPWETKHPKVGQMERVFLGKKWVGGI